MGSISREVRFDWRDQGLACDIVLPLAETVSPPA
jgi:hypothetical protein